MGPRATESGRYRGTTPGIEEAARQLRRRATPAEQVLWQALRRNQLAGRAFRRQHPLGPYVVDSCCPACRLVVEVDGDVHDERPEQDAARTTHLEGYGYRVVRVRNADVLTRLSTVLAEVGRAADQQQAALARRPTPPPS